MISAISSTTAATIPWIPRRRCREIAVQMAVPHHLHRDSQNRRQRSARHRLLPRIRLRRQVHRRLDARSRARCRVHGAHVDEGIRARSHGPARRLDGRRRRPGRRKSRRCAAHHSVSRNRASIARVSWRKSNPRSKSTDTASSSCPKGVRDADGKFLAEAGTKDAFGHSQLGGVGPVVAQMTQEAFGYKFHWAVADYLQRSARHIASKVDVEQAYAVGKAAVEFAAQGQERGDARHRAKILQALSLEHRRGAVGGGRQQGKKGAAQFHHRGRIRHHRGLPCAICRR